MKRPPTHWRAEDLWLSVEPQLPGFTVEVLPEIDSSNSELMRRARSGRTEPILLIAESQTAGRGRQGRTWLNQPGDCLMFSLGLMLAPMDWSGLSLVAGLSIAESLQPAMPAPQQRIGVKWPNDLWLRDGRKLGGTLVETANCSTDQQAPCFGPAIGTPRFVIIGTGINIHPPQPSLSAAAACLTDVDAHWSAPQALQQLLPRLVDDILHFAHHGFAPFMDRFAAHDVLLGQPVHLSDGTHGKALGVQTNGTLQLLTPDGTIRHVISGDVSIRPAHMSLPSHCI